MTGLTARRIFSALFALLLLLAASIVFGVLVGPSGLSPSAVLAALGGGEGGASGNRQYSQ